MIQLGRIVSHLGFLVMLTSCGASQYRAKPMGEGAWRVECLDHVERCLREAERVCGGAGYHVLSGKQETKMFGAEQGYQTGADLHVVEFACGRAEPPPIRLVRHDEPGDMDEPAEIDEAPEPAKTPQAPSCTPGATQRCVGPGACEGGQSCNAEGTAFLPCDCGTTSDPAPAPPDAATLPHTPAPAPTPTSPVQSAIPLEKAAPGATPAGK